MNYSIVDIETSGFAGTANKITEISIFIFDGEKVINEFTSFVNPECPIPYQITSLTGINDKMVKNAPKFYEIAKEVQEITKNTIFVAHNVNFDYGVIRKEYKELGGDYIRKKLCTVRLARKAIPGHKSYSLGNICSALDIPINGRHRARGDAEATVQLFSEILKADPEQTLINSFLKHNSKQSTLPPNLDKNIFENLPTSTGVYYFKDENNNIIYVGKAKDIKQRVLSHFRDNSNKERKMTMEVADVKFRITGNELIALLLESDEIKKHYPKYNRAQKRVRETVALTMYENQLGIKQLAFNATKLVTNPITKFYSESEARLYIETLITEFELCPKHCSIEKVKTGACFSYHLKKCKGVCCGSENIENYNERLNQAILSIRGEFENEIIILKGRKTKEQGIVFIENGIYQGFAFTNKKNITLKNIKEELEKKSDNSDIQRILNYYKRNFDNYKIMTKYS